MGFAPGQLSGEFANGGVSEIDNAQTGEVLSMEDFLKAEENLEHAPSSIHEIEEAAVTATTLLEKELEHKTFQYSQKETGREQNGGVADENTVTEIGRLKVGIQDEADRRKKEEKRNQYRALDLAIQQARDMEHLQAQMARLLEENQKLKDEIAELEKDLDIAEELMANIDDLNSDDPDTRKAARQKTSDYLAKHNIDFSKFENKDGSIDTEAAREAIKHQHSEDEEQKNQKDVELAKNEEEIKEVVDDIENSNYKAEQSAYIAKNDDNNATDSSFDKLDSSFDKLDSSFDKLDSSFDKLDSSFDKLDSAFDNAEDSAFDNAEDSAFDNVEDSAFDNVADNAFDTAFDDIDLYGSNNEQSKIEVNQTAQLEEFNTSNTVGSFSGSGEETASVISAQFAAKADINQPVAEVAPDLQQNNQITPATINGLG